MNKRKVGGDYEQKAAEFLAEHGLEILEKNWRCLVGEIDLIARDGRCLVFVEVKYRADARQGSPLEAVGPAKQQRIRRAAYHYLYGNGFGGEEPCRFDVVGILGGQLTWIRDAF
ncbi:MAG: YraN family protein [Clostridiales bacterium]|nr:YraN family protein [Clostridiales bacterium]